MTLWVVLILAMVVPRANRTRHVLMILPPVLLVYSAWRVLVLILKPSASDDNMFSLLVLSLAVGPAVLLLLGHCLANRRWFVSLLLSIVVALVVVSTAMLSYGLDRSMQTIQIALMLGTFMLVVVLAYALAGRMCRRRYSPVRLVLLLAAGVVGLLAVGMSLLFLASCLVTGSWPSHPLFIFPQITGVSMIIGVCIFLLSLPFVLVGLTSPLSRPRLLPCLRFGPASREPDGTTPLPQDETGRFGLTDSHSI